MNKRHLHHVWKRFRAVKAWYLLLAAVICGVVCLFALRANSQHMASLREAVYTADQNNGDVQTALNNLQAFVTSHMNTDLSTGKGAVYPPIQLQYTYQRLVEQQAGQTQNTNSSLYTEAQAYCQKLNSTDFSGRNRVPCIEQYVQDHGKTTNLSSTISPSLYQFDFVSPRWSPDLAGWTLLAAILLLAMAVLKFAADLWMKRYLR